MYSPSVSSSSQPTSPSLGCCGARRCSSSFFSPLSDLRPLAAGEVAGGAKERYARSAPSAEDEADVDAATVDEEEVESVSGGEPGTALRDRLEPLADAL